MTLVFSAEETAREVAETLARKGIENDPAREGDYRFLTTGDPALFRALGERFLQLPLGEVEHVTLAELAGGRRMRAEAAAGRASPARDRTRLPRAAARLGALVAAARRGALHGVARGGRAALARRPGPRLADRRVLAPSRLDRRADAARGARRAPAGRRTVEIQRLIGRAVRAVTDFQALGERTLWLDCDVLQADGGTRCAAISGAYVAAQRALDRFGLSKALTGSVAAVSVGIVDGEPLLDLDYAEDSGAEVDMNVVMTGDGRAVEVQATAERVPSLATGSTSCSTSPPAGSRRSRGPARSVRRARR